MGPLCGAAQGRAGIRLCCVEAAPLEACLLHADLLGAYCVLGAVRVLGNLFPDAEKEVRVPCPHRSEGWGPAHQRVPGTEALESVVDWLEQRRLRGITMGAPRGKPESGPRGTARCPGSGLQPKMASECPVPEEYSQARWDIRGHWAGPQGGTSFQEAWSPAQPGPWSPGLGAGFRGHHSHPVAQAAPHQAPPSLSCPSCL